jgi:GT2 family glycosyltransferase
VSGAAVMGGSANEVRIGTRLAVVVVNWNGFQDTADCLESLARDARSEAELSCILVDNGSSDGSAERLAARFPWIHVAALGANRGYAAGCNAGMRIALDEGADFVMLLNNDTIVEPGFADAMVSAARDPENREFGMLTPIITELGRPDRVWAAGGSIRLGLCAMGNRRRLPRELGRVTRCDFATGCSLMARRELIEGVGMLDDALFIYVEDVDWSLRARKAGWRIGVVGSATVRHRVSASLSRNTLGDEGGITSGVQHYYNVRNRYIVLRRHGTVLEIATGVVMHTLRSLWLVCGQLLLGRLAKARMTLRGIADGLRMRTGAAAGMGR